MITRNAHDAATVKHFPNPPTRAQFTVVPVTPVVQLGDALKKYRKERNLSQNDVAELMNVTRHTVANWEADRNKPDIDILCKLCGILKVSLQEMMGFTHVPTISREEEHLVKMYRSLSPISKKVALAAVSSMLDEETKAMNAFYSESYIIIGEESGAAAAGAGYDYSDEPIQPVFVRKNSVSCKADSIIRVSGDSMLPVYHDGDLVYISYSESIFPEDDVVCNTADGMVIKRYNEEHKLYSINRALPFGDRYADDHVGIKGKVIGIVDPDDIAHEEDLNALREIFHDQLAEFNKTYGSAEV